jgi:Golgi apparatus protein 1
MMHQKTALIRSALASLVLMLSAGLALSADRKGPCAADARNFCHNVHPGESRIYQCLVSHEARLSPACRDRMQVIREKFDRLARVCGADAEKYCKGVPPGDGRILACLKSHEPELEKACGRTLKRARNDTSMTR